MSVGAPGDQQAALSIGMRRVAHAMTADVDSIAVDVSRAVLTRSGHAPVDETSEYFAALVRSTCANVGTFLSTLAYDVPPASVGPPDGAIELVDQIASDPAGLPELIRMYQLGAAMTWECFLGYADGVIKDRELLSRLILPASRHLSEYLDHVVQCLTVRWDERVLEAVRSGHRTQIVLTALMHGESVDLDLLDHPINGHHMAIACSGLGRAQRLRRVGDRIRRRLPGTRVIDVADIDGADILWVSNEGPPDRDLVVGECASEPGQGFLAVSDADSGARGFERVGREATDTLRAVVRIGGPARAVTFRDVALCTTLLADDERAQRFARVVLGPLAAPDIEASRLRQTLQCYFACGGNKAAAGAALHLHEKTVAYRLRRAARILGVSIDADRLNLEAALSVLADPSEP
ncbi:helix-turn-helix domain-containing protein [Gordonia sp. L191]|uniref:PucR family transcriptional regulator n=1 Tax=Gordonia sp. L191 TaxID=2982699 RepID=UPI0024BF7F61|nr:PucR family transcriptional regulator [Gordonia sp. L191]WHU45822.1 helix-turn-helix domain-containing protein [Gordonia sp. L191]